MSRIGIAVVLCLFLSSGISLRPFYSGAEQAPTAGPVQVPPTRVESVEVLVDVIVTDKRGKPVTDLKPSEFSVFEDGSLQTIRSLWLETEPEMAGAALPAAAPAPAAEGVTVNRRVSPGLVTFLFDSLSLGRQSRIQAIKAARDMILQWPAGGPIAVFLLDRKLSLLAPLNSDRKTLAKALDQVTEGRGKPYASSSDELERLLQASGQRASEVLSQAMIAGSSPPSIEVSAADINALLVNTLRQYETVERELQAQQSVLGLLSLVRSLQNMHGRKTVIFFSEGFAVPENVARQFQSVIASANRANVALYTIDSAGLRLESDGEGASRTLSALGSARANRGSDPTLAVDGKSAMGQAEDLARQNQVGVLSEMAGATGGLLFRNSNDLREALVRVQNDLGAYYLLSYRPSNMRMDGSFRKIQIKISRPDIQIRARSGYNAVPAGDVGLQLEYEQPLWRALLSDPPPGEIELEAGTWRFPASATRDALVVWAKVPIEALQFSPVAPPNDPSRKSHTNEKFVGARLDFMAVAHNALRQVTGKKSQSSELVLPASKLELLGKADVNFQRVLAVPRDRAEVDFIARDSGSGRTAVKRRDSTVPDTEAAGLRMSSIVPVRGVEKASEGDRLEDPLIYNGSRMLTNPGGRIRKARDTQMRFFFSVLTTPGGTVQAQVEFLQNGQLVARAPGELPAADASGLIQFLSEFPVQPFPQGAYAVRVTVEQAGKKTSRQVDITVNP